MTALRDLELECPSCNQRWREAAGAAGRATCPRCGAGEGEMFRALSRKVAHLNELSQTFSRALTVATESAARFKAQNDILNRRADAAGGR